MWFYVFTLFPCSKTQFVSLSEFKNALKSVNCNFFLSFSNPHFILKRLNIFYSFRRHSKKDKKCDFLEKILVLVLHNGRFFTVVLGGGDRKKLQRIFQPWPIHNTFLKETVRSLFNRWWKDLRPSSAKALWGFEECQIVVIFH